MSGEQQLERSVLERKERDELHAIAEEMSLKPGSRAKKADIIDQILRATGVEVTSTGESAVADAPQADGRAGQRVARSTRTRGVGANGPSADAADAVGAEVSPLETSADGPHTDGQSRDDAPDEDSSERRAAAVMATGPSETEATAPGTDQAAEASGSGDATASVEPARRDDQGSGGRRDRADTEGAAGDGAGSPRSSGGGQPRNQRQGGSANGRGGPTSTHEGTAEPGNRRSRRRRGRDRDR